MTESQTHRQVHTDLALNVHGGILHSSYSTDVLQTYSRCSIFMTSFNANTSISEGFLFSDRSTFTSWKILYVCNVILQTDPSRKPPMHSSVLCMLTFRGVFLMQILWDDCALHKGRLGGSRYIHEGGMTLAEQSRESLYVHRCFLSIRR